MVVREHNKKLLLVQRELEQRKDDGMRSERMLDFQVKDLKEKLDTALEANVLLQHDYENADST